jgi:hypothetical protein
LTKNADKALSRPRPAGAVSATAGHVEAPLSNVDRLWRERGDLKLTDFLAE